MYLEQNLNSTIKELLLPFQHRLTFDTKWFGITTQKNPLDFWVYQEMLFDQRPDVLIEIGNYYGGSTLALAHLMDLLGHGQIIAVDIDHSKIDPLARAHPRISWIEKDAPLAIDQVQALINPTDRVMIIDDSAHDYLKTLEILDAYNPLVKIGDYFVVEDGICHHGIPVGPMPGPYEAIKQFLKKNTNWESDRSKESWVLTYNPRGFLRRVA